MLPSLENPLGWLGVLNVDLTPLVHRVLLLVPSAIEKTFVFLYLCLRTGLPFSAFQCARIEIKAQQTFGRDIRDEQEWVTKRGVGQAAELSVKRAEQGTDFDDYLAGQRHSFVRGTLAASF